MGERVGVALWREAELGLILKELPGISGLAVVSAVSLLCLCSVVLDIESVLLMRGHSLHHLDVHVVLVFSKSTFSLSIFLVSLVQGRVIVVLRWAGFELGVCCLTPLSAYGKP